MEPSAKEAGRDAHAFLGRMAVEGEPKAPEAAIDVKAIIGRNLKRAREAADISQEKFAEMVGVSRATLSSFENGHVAIDSARLLKAAQVLGKPAAGFFQQPEEALALLYRPGDHAAPNRPVLARFERLCAAYRELEEIVGVADVPLTPPEYKYSPAFHSKPRQFAAQVAQSERERLGLGQIEPIENIFKLLEGNGVRLFAFGIEPDRVLGVSGFSSRYGPCILVNANNSPERKIFTVAREYGHLLMHRDLYAYPLPVEQKERETGMVADVFAARFLVPDAGLHHVCRKNMGPRSPSAEDIVFLKRHFRVSAHVILGRLCDNDWLFPRERDDYLERLRKVEPDKIEELAPLPADSADAWRETCRFQHLARKAALTEMVSMGKLAELLGKNLGEVRALVHEWRKEIAIVSA